MFQPTRPHGARLLVTLFGILICFVSTHAPAWGATETDKTKVQFDFVSTHAPAWGATKLQKLVVEPSNVSTHAPAWGATAILMYLNFFFLGFNPRARMGRDLIQGSDKIVITLRFQPTRPHGARLEYNFILDKCMEVSTHAPAWGATTCTDNKVVIK